MSPEAQTLLGWVALTVLLFVVGVPVLSVLICLAPFLMIVGLLVMLTVGS